MNNSEKKNVSAIEAQFGKQTVEKNLDERIVIPPYWTESYLRISYFKAKHVYIITAHTSQVNLNLAVQ